MRAWLFQDSRQKQKLGEKAPWSVGWFDVDGSKSQAEKFQRKKEGELVAGLCQTVVRKSWSAFRQEYEQRILPLKAVKTRDGYMTTLDHFERLCKPTRLAAIKTVTIDQFIADRSKDPGRKPDSTVSPATVNHDLRQLKAALQIAHDWGYLTSMPKFRKVREAEEIGLVVTPEDFEAIYEACGTAKMPERVPCTPKDWWQALLLFGLTTGWRIEEILELRRADLNLETGQIITRARDNKGNRDEIDHLPPVTLAHIQRVTSESPLVFEWPHRDLIQIEQMPQALDIEQDLVVVLLQLFSSF